MEDDRLERMIEAIPAVMAQPRRTMPSREFLVQRATLTALHTHFPASIAFYGRRAWAAKVEGLVRDDFESGRDFVGAVRSCFAALVAKHGGVTCPSP